MKSSERNGFHVARHLFCSVRRFALVVTLAWMAAPASAESELWQVGADGTNCKRLAETPGFRCGSPDWSPDGEWIAYDTWKHGESFEDSQIGVVRADGTSGKLLGPGAMPSWSPDGKQLVFHTYAPQHEIVVMNADGTEREAILDHWGSPRWSPRGNRIATISSGTIALYDIVTGEERPIFDGQYSLRQGFGISPDGLRFCFPDATGGVGIATLDEETMQAKVRWIVASEHCFHASWAPDGQRVVFALAPDEHGGDQLYTMDVDKDTTPTWLPGQDPTRTNTNPDWSPDGKTIVFCRQGPFEPASE